LKKEDKIKRSPTEENHAEVIAEAVDILKTGGIVVYPTRCLYGLGADALNSEAVNRVFSIKQRPLDKPLLILVPGRDSIDSLVKWVPLPAVKIMDRFWPGKVTIIFDAAKSLPENLHAGKNKIGIRLPGHPLAKKLVESFGKPITGTSANLSGSSAASRINELSPLLFNKIDLILDAGSLQGGTGSTVVDVTGESVDVLREGVVSRSEILNAISS
jgi:L-threonylcarbamoyladenylate synthase